MVSSIKMTKKHTECADLLWEDDVPVNKMFNDPYFSLVSGEAESQYVFLAHNNIPDVFLKNNTFSIAETGFGTGLNFFVTAQKWVEVFHLSDRVEGINASSDTGGTCHKADEIPHLYYFSIEKYPISRQELIDIHAQWPQYQIFSHQLMGQYAGNVSGFHRINFPDQNITLILMIGDVNDMLLEMDTDAPKKIDAWYLDGFSPSKNPDMWSENVFNKIAKLSHAKTTFSTFTAAGFVRRAMKASGFDVKKASGFGKKREMLCGHVLSESALVKHEKINDVPSANTNIDTNARPVMPPWYSLEDLYVRDKSKSNKPVVIIGGGIAGLSCALSLAERNIHSILLESAASLGAGASGNLAGIVMPRISAAQDAESAFYINAFLYAANYYNALKKCFPKLQWNQNGVLRFDSQKKITQIGSLELPDALVEIVNSDTASNLANLYIADSALYMPQAGTINPQQLCEILAQAAGDKLQIIPQSRVDRLEKNDEGWLIKGANNHLICSAEKVIIANGHDAARLLKTETLTVEPSRGQLSYVSETMQSSKLKINLCGEGYVVPAHLGVHVVGASYGGESVELTCGDAEKNISNAKTLLNDDTFGHAANVKRDKRNSELIEVPQTGRVSFRAVTKDHLPIVGPVVDEAFYLTHYHNLHFGKPQKNYCKAKYEDGLFLSVGHGSRGLVTCVASANYLAALITEQPILDSASTVKLLHPGRFLVRSFVKGRTKV